MQAMSMIDTSNKVLDALVPARPVQPQEKSFGKVMEQQRQPEAKQPVAEKAQPAAAKAKPETPAAERAEVKSEPKPAEQPAEETTETVAEAKSKLQQTLIDLMQALAGQPAGQEKGEDEASIEDLLSQLVEQLDGELEAGELKVAGLEGEQVLAGIDLSALVEQLQQLKAAGGDEQLEQLVEQLADQLESQLDDSDLLANAELAAASMAADPAESVAANLKQNLTQARQLLQQAIDQVATPKGTQVAAEEVAVEDGQEAGEELLFAEETAEEIDPRFAELLKPRSEKTAQPQQSLRQQVQARQQLNPGLQQAEAPIPPEATPELSDVAELAQQLDTPAKQGLEQLLQQGQVHAQPSTAQLQQPTGRLMPENPVVQLPNGQQVTEGQIFDQVVTRFSSSFNGSSQKMVLRMQPAELGSLKIELQVEGDKIRANLHAQSQQVQEVLERNLPQLRNALAEQGLKIDQFQVDVNRDQGQQQQFDQLAQQQQQRQGSQPQHSWQPAWETEEQIIPLAHLMQNGGGGISLHV